MVNLPQQCSVDNALGQQQAFCVWIRIARIEANALADVALLVGQVIAGGLLDRIAVEAYDSIVLPSQREDDALLQAVPPPGVVAQANVGRQAKSLQAIKSRWTLFEIRSKGIKERLIGDGHAQI